MWAVTALLLLGVTAQPGFPPCGLFGEPLANMSVTWSPEVPSLQSLVTFNISGVSVSYTGGVDPTVVFELESFQLLPEVPIGFWPMLKNNTEFSFLWTVPIPGPLLLPCGIYQYHIYLCGLSICIQEVVGTIAIGTTVPFTVSEFTWTPTIILPDTSASFLLEGQNGSKETLNIKECQLEILTDSSQLLDKVTCEASEIQPAALFRLTSDSIEFPDLAAGNYTVRVHFYDEVEVGYVETSFQVAAEYPLSLMWSMGWPVIVNNGKDTITIGSMYMTLSNADMYHLSADIQTINVEEGQSCGFPAVYWVIIKENITLSGCGVVTDNKNVTIAVFTWSQVVVEDTEITSITVFPTVLTSSDILVIDVQGDDIANWRVKYNLANYGETYFFNTSTVYEIDSNHTIFSMNLSQIDYPPGSYLTPGSYLICVTEIWQFTSVIIDVFENIVSSSKLVSLNNTFPEQFTPGGYININSTLLDLPSYTTCQLSVANSSVTWEWGQLYCQQRLLYSNVYELLLPVVPLPAQFSDLATGPYILKIEFINSTGDVVGNVQEALYLSFDAQISPQTFSIFPTSIAANDTLNVTIEGQANSQFTNLTLASSAFYNSSSRLIFQSELTVLNLTWQGNSFQLNASLSSLWTDIPGDYTLGLCLETVDLGLYCWNVNTTLISGYRLAVSNFHWSQSTPVLVNTTVAFNFSITALTVGNFSQNLCNVTLFSAGDTALSDVIVCEAGVMGEGDTAEVTSGTLQLPASLTEGEYNATIQLLSNNNLVNGEISSVLVLRDPPTPPPPTPNYASFLIAWLWVFAS